MTSPADAPAGDTAAPDLVARAADFAIHAHRRIDQRRKYTSLPYDVHLRRVVEIVGTITAEPEVLAAAWLHDTVEDTPATLEDVEGAFGARVARLVAELTDVSLPSHGNRAVRKAIDRRHLSRASAEAKSIKLADLIDNCQDIVRHDAAFGRVFVTEATLLLEVLDGGHPGLLARARQDIGAAAKTLGVGELVGHALTLPETPPSAAPPAADPERRRRVARLFGHAIHGEDIAEPLSSFDYSANPVDIARILDEREQPLAGARREGEMVGYVRRVDLEDGLQDSDVRPFEPDQVVDGDAPLTDVVHVLTRHEYCFVRLLGAISGYISRAQMQTPAGRMWLFGLVTLIELTFTERVKAAYPDRSWQAALSPARLAKARELQKRRAERGVDAPLIDCLQFADKARLFIDHGDNLSASGLKSRKAARRVLEDLESLRDDLVHAQDVVTHDWPQIARLARLVEELEAGS